MRSLTWHLGEFANFTTRSFSNALEMLYAWSQSQSLRGIDRAGQIAVLCRQPH
jgi:hypothetical protein